MKINFFSYSEKTRLLVVAILGTIVGLTFGDIWIGLAIGYFLYSLWLLQQAHRVDTWLKDGARRSRVPDTDGVLGHIEQLIFRRKTSDRNRKKRLKKILSLYNQSASALPDATVITNHRFEIVWANDAAFRHLGIRGARDSGQRIDNLLRAPEFHHYVANFDPDNEIEFPSPVNRQMVLAVRCVNYAENLYLFIARDVSQRVRLRETRAAFVANASHELKTPLTVVNGYLEMLADDETLSDDARGKLQIAERHALRMSEIVSDLLTLSRLENQEPDTKKMKQLPVGLLLESAVADIRNTVVDLTHRFDVEVDPSLLLHGSEVEIKSLCSNLCYNAVQHTPTATDVIARWESIDGSGQLTVSDNGPGIEQSHLNHITERFYRVDNEHSRESGGTGLGLSIVKHIVQRHRGELDIRSTPGAGTSFTIVFPPEVVAHTASTATGAETSTSAANL
jgi:two-component system phosphate regulon sensor histidine kinase PhoR